MKLPTPNSVMINAEYNVYGSKIYIKEGSRHLWKISTSIVEVIHK